MTDAQKIDRLETANVALTIERDALRKIFNILMTKIMEEKDEQTTVARIGHESTFALRNSV